MQYVKVKGAEIPALGLGTYKLRDREATDIIREALDVGYRHIDTAQMYANEREVGKAIQLSGLDRDEVFLTSKVWWTNLPHDKFMRSVESSLTQLQVDQLDLLLIHWPHPDLELEHYLEELVRMREQGRTRFIGVSNFTPDLVQRAAAFDDGLVTNQVEYHPYLDQSSLLKTCRKQGLSLTAYAPLAHARVTDDPKLRTIGEKHGKTAAQVTLRWHLQQEGVIAIPKTSSPERLRENFELFDFELSGEEMNAIFNLTEKDNRLIDPAYAPAWES